MQQNRPIITIRTTLAAPIPLWEAHRLFVEPVYADEPYDQAAPDAEAEEYDLERPAA